MKILSINSIQTFTNSKKSKLKFNNKVGSNITVSEANPNGRWFYSKCDNPSYRVYLDEIKPEINKPQIDFEYYDIKRNEDGEDILIPITGEVIMQDGRVQVSNGDNIYDFSGISYKKQNGELIQEVRHAKGYPFNVIDYKDGKEYKYTHYSQNSHKMNQIYYYDGSFELSQKITPQNTSATIELQTLNKNGEKIAVQFTAVKNKNNNGSAKCEVPEDDGYKTIILEWSYPSIKYSFSGTNKDAVMLANTLFELSKTIKLEEYKDDFNSCGYLNAQLKDAIIFLDSISDEN